MRIDTGKLKHFYDLAAALRHLEARRLDLQILGFKEDSDVEQAIDDLTKRLNDVTNRIAIDVDSIRVKEQALLDQATHATDGMVASADVVAALSPNLDKLEAMSNQLTALGQDPGNPVPAA